MGTESSVVVALREVRRLEIERQRREEEGRQRAQEARAQEAHQRMTMEHGRASAAYPVQGHHATGGWPAQQGGYGDGYMNGHGQGYPNGQVRRTAEVLPFPGQGQGRFETGAHAAQPWDPAYGGEAAPRKSSSFTTFVFTFLICAGGAGAGYWKLNQDFQQKLSALQADNRRLELARQDALDGVTKAKQDAKLNITALETKLVVAGAKVAAVEKASLDASLHPLPTTPEPATAKPVAAKPVAAKPAAAKPAVASKGADRQADRRSSAKSRRLLAKATIERPKASRATAAKADTVPEEKPFVAPKISKKTMNDDPLGGLVLPAKSM
jgi:hypothetical protein